MTPPPDPTALLGRLEAEAKLWEPSPLTVLLREAIAALIWDENDIISQRVIGHGEGQAHTIADVNAGRVDDLIAPRLLAAHAQQAEEIARLRAELAEALDNQRKTYDNAVELRKYLERALAEVARLKADATRA